MSSPIIPTSDQLAQARLSQWHQNGEALLTFENLRSWINAAGLVLFTPRPSQLPAPAPSLVEGVLGTSTLEPASVDMGQARTLLARLISEGVAVPLNLLGTSGETPDFVVSAPVFSYIFTLRGDKAWKQQPATIGAVKVSPLAAAAHEVLSKTGALSAYDLTTQLGKEVTESAVLRALNELWAHLRVIPVGQPDGNATLWELTSARFTKHIKAGANAGQPSALSALISLYLGSALLATEEEIETFLSPLAARSRIRDVVHALLGARELETVAIDGKTLLHVSGALPAFAVVSIEDSDVHAKPVETIAVAAAFEETDTPRIKKFVAKPRKLGTGFPSDYGRKFSGAPLDPRDIKSNRERRPFTRGGGEKPFNKPAYNKPWEEEKSVRPPAANVGDKPAAPQRPKQPFDRPAAPSFSRKPRFDRGTEGGRKAFEDKPAFSKKPAFGNRPKTDDRPNYGARPSSRERSSVSKENGRSEENGRPARREFTPRFAAEGESRAPRRTFSKPGTFGRKRDGFGDKPAFGAKPKFESFRSPRPRTFDHGGQSAGQAGSFARTSRSDRPERSDSVGRSGSRSADFAPRTPGSFNARPRPQGGTGFSGKSGFSRNREEDPGERTGRPTYRKFDAPRERSGSGRPTGGDRPSRSNGNDRGGDAARPYKSGYKGDKKPYSKPVGGGLGPKKPGSFSAKPASTFAKFAEGKNPFRKPGKPGGKAGSFKGKSTNYGETTYRERKPKAGGRA